MIQISETTAVLCLEILKQANSPEALVKIQLGQAQAEIEAALGGGAMPTTTTPTVTE